MKTPYSYFMGLTSNFSISTQAQIKKTLFLTLFVLIQSACACVPIKSQTITFPIKSFVQIFKTIKIKKCKPKTACQIGDYTSTGSGAVIGHANGYSAIITARHVCDIALNKKTETMILEKEVSVSIRNWADQAIPGKILYKSPNLKLDLCTLKVYNFGAAKIQVAKKGPEIGEKVYAMSAPMGIYHAPTVPLLEGLYSGPIEDGVNSLVTVPAVGGSSGSVLLNADMKVVGVIFASVRAFPHITLASSHTETKKFIQKSLSKLRQEPPATMSIE